MLALSSCNLDTNKLATHWGGYRHTLPTEFNICARRKEFHVSVLRQVASVWHQRKTNNRPPPDSPRRHTNTSSSRPSHSCAWCTSYCSCTTPAQHRKRHTSTSASRPLHARAWRVHGEATHTAVAASQIDYCKVLSRTPPYLIHFSLPTILGSCLWIEMNLCCSCRRFRVVPADLHHLGVV